MCIRDRNRIKARAWYKKAAEKGNAGAMNNLGVLYAKGGYGLKQDYSTALMWYQKAANKGHADAMNNFGLLYHNSKVVSPAEAGDKDAIDILKEVNQ